MFKGLPELSPWVSLYSSDGNVFQNSSFLSWFEISMYGSHGNTFENNQMPSCRFWVRGGNSNKFIGNDLSGETYSSKIELIGGEDNYFESNTITDSGDVCGLAGGAVFISNDSVYSGVGFFLNKNNVFKQNIFKNNACSILLLSGLDNQFIQNLITENSDDKAISIIGAKSTLFEGNQVVDNQHKGIVNGGCDSIFKNNILTGNLEGNSLNCECGGNVCEGNVE